MAPEILRKIIDFLEEDIGYGDITTHALIGKTIQAHGEIVCTHAGVLAGADIAASIFKRRGCSIISSFTDGQEFLKGSKIMTIDGPAIAILESERVVLNILSRMSGVATKTKQILESARKANPKIILAATRKTLPGFRIFDKNAVLSGGGDPHRLRLDDCVLIKDNHLQLVNSVEEAIQKARSKVSFTKKVEVEVTTLKQVEDAAGAGADIIMLDNFSPEKVKEAVKMLEDKGLRSRVLIEASGNITVNNAAVYALSGVDVISSGAITHSAANINMSLGIMKYNS